MDRRSRCLIAFLERRPILDPAPVSEIKQSGATASGAFFGRAGSREQLDQQALQAPSLALVERRQAAHRPGRFALYQVGAGYLGLLQLPKGGFHIEVAVSDLDLMHRRLLAAGLEPAGEPRERPWGERAFNLVDPDGNVLEIQEA